MAPAAPRPRRHRDGAWPWAVHALALLVLSGSWALAGPRFSAPDEPAHVLKAAAVVRGQLRSPPDPDGEGQLVEVPERLAGADLLAICFAFRSEVTADCAADELTGSTEPVEVSTQAGSYPPLYYALVGWPTLVSLDADVVYAMRLVGAVANVALLVVATMALATLVGRRLAMAGMLVVATPMVLFLSGSVNPSGLEASAAVAAWCCALAVADRSTARRAVGAPLAWGLAVAGGVLASTRWLGPAFLALVLAGAALARPLGPLVRGAWAARRERALVGAALALAVTAGVAGAVTLATPDRILLPGAPVPPGDAAAEAVLGNAQGYLRSMIGVFGWLDVPTPTFTYWAWLALLAGLVGAALLVGRASQVRTIVAVAALSALLPFSQLPSAADLGLPWQGRYALPVAAGVPLVALLAVEGARRAGRLRVGTTRLVLAVAPLAAAGHLVAFAWAERRYATGLHGSFDIWRDARWAPPGGNLVLLTAVAAALGTVVALALAGEDARTGAGARVAEVGPVTGTPRPGVGRRVAADGGAGAGVGVGGRAGRRIGDGSDQHADRAPGMPVEDGRTPRSTAPDGGVADGGVADGGAADGARR